MEDPIKIKADLIPYAPEYAQDVLSWIDSPETYRDLCRGQDWPPPQDMVESWQRKNVSAYLLFAERQPVAYGELWSRPLEMAVEIAHLIVAPARRSQGYGTRMLQELYGRAASRGDVAKVLLNLYSENEIALGCFVKAGFELMGTSSYITGLKMVRLVK